MARQGKQELVVFADHQAGGSGPRPPKIFDAIQTLAMTEGYDLVIVDDSGDALPFDRSSRLVPQAQVLQQLAMRKVLFVNPTLDITEDLIMRMNNEFNAAQARP